MDAATIVRNLRLKGVILEPVGDKLRYYPRDAVNETELDALRQHKAEVLALLSGCRNPLTPHTAHEYPWECNPSTCDCYRLFGEPRWCQGIPCRWVWPTSRYSSKRRGP